MEDTSIVIAGWEFEAGTTYSRVSMENHSPDSGVNFRKAKKGKEKGHGFNRGEFAQKVFADHSLHVALRDPRTLKCPSFYGLMDESSSQC